MLSDWLGGITKYGANQGVDTSSFRVPKEEDNGRCSPLIVRHMRTSENVSLSLTHSDEKIRGKKVRIGLTKSEPGIQVRIV